jgi:SSS family solute:Na+ symporter
VLDRLDKVQADPMAAKMAFQFDPHFAELNPDVARRMVDTNRAVAGTNADVVAGTNADVDADLHAQNSAILAEIKRANGERPAADRVEVQTSVLGYKFDSAFPLLMKHLMFPGVGGFVFAALFGAVISSLAAVLNAASTMFTMDLYSQYLNRNATQGNLVMVGRICVALFAAVGCFISPLLGNPRFGGIFTYIQEFQGFISPGVLAVFIFGLFVHRAPRACGAVGLLICPIIYLTLMFGTPNMAFLNRMAITFGATLGVLALMTIMSPLAQPVTLPEQNKIALEGSTGAKFWGVVVVIATLALYGIFF